MQCHPPPPPPQKSIPSVNAKSPRSPKHCQPPRHPQTIPHHIQFAALDLLPPHRDLRHRDGRALGQHQHLDIKNPAFRVHVRNDVWERRAREEFEAALSVFDGGCCGGSEQAEEQVERVHEEVAEH